MTDLPLWTHPWPCFTLDLTLNTDDVFCLTQCYSPCHYLKDYRHSKTFWYIGHKRCKSQIIFYYILSVNILSLTWTITYFTQILMICLIVLNKLVFQLKLWNCYPPISRMNPKRFGHTDHVYLLLQGECWINKKKILWLHPVQGQPWPGPDLR